MDSKIDRQILVIVSWVFSIIGVGWFIWPIIGLVMDPNEPKLLTIFGFSWLFSLGFLTIGSLLRLSVRREAGATSPRDTKE